MRFSENLNLPILQDGDKYSKEIQNEAFNTIDRECTSIKNTIKSALDISEDVSNAIKTLGDISEELSDLKEKQNEDYYELLESNNYIGNKIRDINSQLDSIMINVKNFISDDNDTQGIKNAIDYMEQNNLGKLFFPKGTYKISSNIKLCSGEYIGEHGTILILDNWNGEECISNKNNSLSEINLKDTIIIKNITFKLGTNKSGYGVRFINTENTVIENCSFITNENNTLDYSALDFYSNNKNITINNCIFNMYGQTNTLITPILIREFVSTKLTENVNITNCHFEVSGGDETLWIDGWKGKIKNVVVDNCIINDIGDSQNTIWIGANTSNSSIEDVEIKNCKIIREQIHYRVFAISDSQDSTPINNYSDLVKIHDNIIIVKTKPSNVTVETSLFFIGRYQLKEDSISLYNNVIECCINSNKVKYIFRGASVNKNNKINCKAEYVYLSSNLVKGDIVNNTEGCIARNCKELDSVIAKSTENFMNNNNCSLENIIVKNCDIECSGSAIHHNSPTLATTFNLSNNKINCGSSNVLEIWNVPSPQILLMDNCNISTSDMVNSGGNVKLSINSIKINGENLGTIPTVAKTRQACIVGTIILSNTQGKILHRKISNGDSTSNWETI